MKIDFDPSKRLRTLKVRALDFLDASIVLDGRTATIEDKRKEYGETRFITFGTLAGRMVVIGWTPRIVNGERVYRVFSMRKANEREIARYSERLG